MYPCLFLHWSENVISYSELSPHNLDWETITASTSRGSRKPIRGCKPQPNVLMKGGFESVCMSLCASLEITLSNKESFYSLAKNCIKCWVISWDGTERIALMSQLSFLWLDISFWRVTEKTATHFMTLFVMHLIAFLEDCVSFYTVRRGRERESERVPSGSCELCWGSVSTPQPPVLVWLHWRRLSLCNCLGPVSSRTRLLLWLCTWSNTHRHQRTRHQIY